MVAKLRVVVEKKNAESVLVEEVWQVWCGKLNIVRHGNQQGSKVLI